ncbi:hypothetical protein HA402_003852 [Bradysia odoriphaga]|nr:hypothetical protein HA402_003852 [Bradysia odoriphaga]
MNSDYLNSAVSLNRKRKNNGASDWEAAGSYVNIVEVQQFHQRDDSADTEFDFHVTENHQLVQIDAQVLSPIDTNYTHQSTQTENHQLVQIDAQVLPNPMDTNYSHQATQTEGELGRKKPQGRSRTLLVSRWNSSVKRVRIVRKKSTPYSCAQWVLSQVGSLVRQHQRFHSGAGEKQFKRSEHKIAFGDIDILTRHQEVHSGENKVDKPFKCPTCHAGFSRNNHLTRHLLIHTNERPFACDICNRSFRRKDSLKSHVNIHTGERPFACEICNRSFQRKHHLRDHMNIHIGGKDSRKRRV